MNDRVSITMLEDGIADVRMTRIDKMNALDPAQWDAVIGAINELKVMPGLRVVVLSGEGADEAFLGYDIFKETMLRQQWHWR